MTPSSYSEQGEQLAADAAVGGRPGGAYGFRIEGVDAAPTQLIEAPRHWPPIQVSVRVTSESAPGSDEFDARRASVRLRSGGWVVVERGPARATFSLPAPPRRDALLHPHLAPAAAVAANWLGRDSYHAGAFVANGGTWGLLGEKGSGKSSMLASLASAGLAVLCDDLLVLDDDTALAGPRSVDLRRDAAARLGVGEPLGLLGRRERWRLPLAPVEPELPLRGWIALRWGSETAIRPLKGSLRLQKLLLHRALRVQPPHASAPIKLSSLPVLELTRPNSWDSMGEAVARLLAAVA